MNEAARVPRVERPDSFASGKQSARGAEGQQHKTDSGLKTYALAAGGARGLLILGGDEALAEADGHASLRLLSQRRHCDKKLCGFVRMLRRGVQVEAWQRLARRCLATMKPAEKKREKILEGVRFLILHKTCGRHKRDSLKSGDA